jgi:hypothetical protein
LAGICAATGRAGARVAVAVLAFVPTVCTLPPPLMHPFSFTGADVVPLATTRAVPMTPGMSKRRYRRPQSGPDRTALHNSSP